MTEKLRVTAFMRGHDYFLQRIHREGRAEHFEWVAEENDSSRFDELEAKRLARGWPGAKTCAATPSRAIS
jgi:hypothetical protein